MRRTEDEITRESTGSEAWSPWAYWVDHCDGFRVDTLQGRLGFVEEVRAGEGGRPRVLAVRAGVLGRRLLLVPTDDVAAVSPASLRVRLAPTFSILASEPAHERHSRRQRVAAAH